MPVGTDSDKEHRVDGKCDIYGESRAKEKINHDTLQAAVSAGRYEFSRICYGKKRAGAYVTVWIPSPGADKAELKEMLKGLSRDELQALLAEA